MKKRLIVVLFCSVLSSCRKTYSVTCHCYNDKGEVVGFSSSMTRGKDETWLREKKSECALADKNSRDHDGYCTFREKVE